MCVILIRFNIIILSNYNWLKMLSLLVHLLIEYLNTQNLICINKHTYVIIVLLKSKSLHTQYAYIIICYIKCITSYSQTWRYYHDNSIMWTGGGKYKSLPYSIKTKTVILCMRTPTKTRCVFYGNIYLEIIIILTKPDHRMFRLLKIGATNFLLHYVLIIQSL